MASLSLYPQFETNLISTRKVIEPLLQLKSVKAHGKNCTKVRPHLVRHLLRNCLLKFRVPVCLRRHVIRDPEKTQNIGSYFCSSLAMFQLVLQEFDNI